MKRDKIQAMFDDNDIDGLVALHSDCLKTLEVIWRKAAKKFEGKPLSSKALSMHFQFKVMHCEADLLAAEVYGVPTPRSGER